MCGRFDPMCHARDALKDLIGNAIVSMAEAILEAVGKVLASLGTFWVRVDTPNLTSGDGATSRDAGAVAANFTGINTILGWSTWIAFGVCVISLMAAGARMGMRSRDGEDHVDRIAVVLMATIVISAAVGLVTKLVPMENSSGSPTVAYIQNSLWWYMIALATFSVIIGAARMAWEQRAAPGKDLVKSLLTLVVVSGAGLSGVSLLVAASDSFSEWIIDGSLKCGTGEGEACFGANMVGMMALGSGAVGIIGPMLVIIMGFFAVVGSVAQIIVMVVRSGMLVILAGMLPISAAATNTETGRAMFQKTTAWLLAFILYKPAAAIVYATAFRLTGDKVFGDDDTGLINVIVGLTMMIAALVALPALMKLIVPAVAAVPNAQGLTDAAHQAASKAMPSGAVERAGRSIMKKIGESASNSADSEPTGSTMTGPSGQDGAPGKPGPKPNPSPSRPNGGSPKGGSGNATAGALKTNVGTTAGGGAAAGASAAPGGGTAAGGGGAAAGGAAAGGGAAAAAGPIGAAVAAAGKVAMAIAKTAMSTVKAATNDATGSVGAPSGPDGSRLGWHSQGESKSGASGFSKSSVNTFKSNNSPSPRVARGSS